MNDPAQQNLARQSLSQQELPIWMRKAMHSTDWGMLIVLAFSLMAGWSFLLQPGLPRTNASEHYIYRAADMARAFAEGRLYPRWSPNALNGYGAPIPQFYPPGAAYLPALISFFVTGDATQAVKLVYVGALMLAGASVYAFVTRRSAAAAGVIAALLYVYSPYIGLTAPHLLGDLPGVICLALIPALLWSVDRLLRANRPLDLAYVALITAGLLLTDPPATAAGWVLAASLLIYSRPDSGTFYRTITALTLGVATAACYWLPALVEAGSVQWFARPLLMPQNLSLVSMFMPLRQLDPAALLHMPQFTLGLALPIFALTAIPVVARQGSFHRLFLILGVILILLAITLMRAEVWLVGVISLCLAIGASALVFWNKSRLFLPILSGLILGAAVPIWIAPNWSEAPIDTSPLAQIEYEQQGFGIATLPHGNALPSLVTPDTPASRALLAGYREGSINKAEQNAEAQIGILAHDSHEDKFQIQTFAPLTLSVLTADFPGWSAYLNDVPLPLSHDSVGLIQVSVPDTRSGELLITLATTPVRTLAWVITWMAILILVIIIVRRSRQASPSDHYEPLELLKTGQARLLTVLMSGFAVVLALVALPSAPLAAQVMCEEAFTDSSRIDNPTNSGLELLAYRLDQASVQPGSTVNLSLYWQAAQPLDINYQVRVSLLDLSTGTYRLSTALRNPGGFPTLRWQPRLYVPDIYTITPPANMPHGSYSPAVEVCAPDCVSASRLNFFGYDGGTYGSVLVLPIILSVE